MKIIDILFLLVLFDFLSTTRKEVKELMPVKKKATTKKAAAKKKTAKKKK